MKNTFTILIMLFSSMAFGQIITNNLIVIGYYNDAEVNKKEVELICFWKLNDKQTILQSDCNGKPHTYYLKNKDTSNPDYLEAEYICYENKQYGVVRIFYNERTIMLCEEIKDNIYIVLAYQLND